MWASVLFVGGCGAHERSGATGEQLQQQPQRCGAWLAGWRGALGSCGGGVPTGSWLDRPAAAAAGAGSWTPPVGSYGGAATAAGHALVGLLARGQSGTTEQAETRSAGPSSSGGGGGTAFYNLGTHRQFSYRAATHGGRRQLAGPLHVCLHGGRAGGCPATHIHSTALQTAASCTHQLPHSSHMSCGALQLSAAPWGALA